MYIQITYIYNLGFSISILLYCGTHISVWIILVEEFHIAFNNTLIWLLILIIMHRIVHTNMSKPYSRSLFLPQYFISMRLMYILVIWFCLSLVYCALCNFDCYMYYSHVHACFLYCIWQWRKNPFWGSGGGGWSQSGAEIFCASMHTHTETHYITNTHACVRGVRTHTYTHTHTHTHTHNLLF